jgi:hypothetical protein
MRYGVSASISVKPGEIADLAARAPLIKKPERQRGLWSFLTWSFFLPQVMATESFFGKGAHAAQDHYDGVVSHAASDSGSTFDDMPAASWIAARADDVREDEASNSQHSNHAARSLLLVENLQQGGTTLGLKPSGGDTNPTASGGGGGGSRSGDSNFFSSDGADEGLAPEPNQVLVALGPDVSKAPDLNVDVSSVPDLHPDRVLEFDVDIKQPPELKVDVSSRPDLHLNHVISDVSVPGNKAPDLNSAGLELNVAQPVGLTTEVDLNHLLGLDVRLSTDGILAGVDISLASVFNADRLISDLAENIGLKAGVDLNHLLGLDVRFSGSVSGGADVGLLQALNPDHVVSDLTQTVGLITGVNLNHVLGFDAQFGVASVIGLHAGPEGLPVNNDSGEAPAHLIKSTLAEVTGLQLFGDPGSLTAQLVDNPNSDARASLTKAIDVLTGQSGDIGTLKASPPMAHLMSDLTGSGGLQQSGDLSSGGTLNFPAQTLAQIDELFSGDRYTEYHVTLQSPNPNIGNIPGTLKSDTVDHADASPSPTDTLSGNHHEASAPPIIEHAADASLVHTSIPIPHLNSH